MVRAVWGGGGRRMLAIMSHHSTATNDNLISLTICGYFVFSVYTHMYMYTVLSSRKYLVSCAGSLKHKSTCTLDQ